MVTLISNFGGMADVALPKRGHAASSCSSAAPRMQTALPLCDGVVIAHPPSRLRAVSDSVATASFVQLAAERENAPVLGCQQTAAPSFMLERTQSKLAGRNGFDRSAQLEENDLRFSSFSLSGSRCARAS